MTTDKPSHSGQGYIKGELLYTIFRNEQEDFTIAKITIHETNEDYQEKEIVIKGYFSELQESAVYSFYGTFERHAKFGLQYKVNSYQTFIPDTKDGLISYLSSDLFHGIGKTAEKIVSHLGTNAIAKILNNPDSLKEVPGLKKDKAELVSRTVVENQGFEHIAVYLSKYGIGLKLAQKSIGSIKRKQWRCCRMTRTSWSMILMVSVFRQLIKSPGKTGFRLHIRTGLAPAVSMCCK